MALQRYLQRCAPMNAGMFEIQSEIKDCRVREQKKDTIKKFKKNWRGKRSHTLI